MTTSYKVYFNIDDKGISERLPKWTSIIKNDGKTPTIEWFNDVKLIAIYYINPQLLLIALD